MAHRSVSTWWEGFMMQEVSEWWVAASSICIRADALASLASSGICFQSRLPHDQGPMNPG